MADDYLFLACRLCGEGWMIAKLSAGYDADGGENRPGTFIGKHIESCGLPAVRRLNTSKLSVGELVKQMIGLFTQDGVTWMGYLSPDDEKDGQGGCRIKPALRISGVVLNPTCEHKDRAVDGNVATCKKCGQMILVH